MFFKERAARELVERAREDEAAMRHQAQAAEETARTLAEVRRLNNQAQLLATLVPTLGDRTTPAAIRALEQAEKVAQAAKELAVRLDRSDPEQGALKVTLALLQAFGGHPDKAEGLAREALRTLPRGHPDATLANNLLALSLRAQNRNQEADQVVERELPGLAGVAARKMDTEQNLQHLRERARFESNLCTNNLRQIVLALKIWALDHDGALPFDVPRARGGTLEFSSAGSDGFEQNAAPHFLVMSNELVTAKILVCPADSSKAAAATFQELAASNVTYQLRSRPSPTPQSTNEVLVRCPIHGYQLSSGTIAVRPANQELK
jgi:hypothetical protein